MFDFFNRSKNKIENPAILVAAIGERPSFPQDKAIYAPYSNLTEFTANNLAALETFLSGKTFDMVHLFVTIAADGTLDGEAGIKLLQILTKSNTKLALFASGNPVDNYMAAFPADLRKGIDNMHLVLTLDRKGDSFARFFKSLFDLMAQGKSMPVAWVTLAPQHEGSENPESPDCIFEARRGQLKFVP